MKKDQLPHCIGHQMTLLPPVVRLGANGDKLPAPAEDSWIVLSITPTGVVVQSAVSGQARQLGFDHIYSFTSDEEKAGVKRGFFQALEGSDVRYR